MFATVTVYVSVNYSSANVMGFIVGCAYAEREERERERVKEERKREIR
jgi:hypothetical protein